MSETRANPTGVYGLLRRSPVPLTNAQIAAEIGIGNHRSRIIVRSLVAAGLAHYTSLDDDSYTAIEIESTAARRKALKFARELWQLARPLGNSEARSEIMKFKSGRYS